VLWLSIQLPVVVPRQMATSFFDAQAVSLNMGTVTCEEFEGSQPNDQYGKPISQWLWVIAQEKTGSGGCRLFSTTG
jgi:hypothetical protein